MADEYKPDPDLAKEGRELFSAAEAAESDNRRTYLDDISFAREGKQWADDVAKARMRDKRPMLTINKLPTVIRQVVNDARQNKPSIKVHPVDSGADKATAEVINGLIRNIETTSNADVAYDTATECAVAGGFGYLRVGLDFAYEDSFDMDLSIQRIANPLSVYGDPNSTAADSSDWNDAFVVDQIPEEQFEKEYKGKAAVDFGSAAWQGVGTSWRNQETKTVTIAEWWHREEYEKPIVLCNDGKVYAVKDVESNPDLMALFDAGVLQVQSQRMAKCHRVEQRMMTGAEVIKVRPWPGKYIPIIPVYGEEFDIEGKRFYRSLIHNAIDAQRMYNAWRTIATELVALSPRVPWIGRKGAFATDQDRWESANAVSHSYLEYDGPEAPQRQMLDGGVAAGALQEALNAADDIKATTGLFDASLGAKSNETSGRAIMARQREGDVSTFHFMDNMARAIRHTGRILIDLIPHVYNTERIIRVLGEDGTPEPKPINQQYQQTDPKTGEPMMQEAVDPMGQKVMQAVMAMHDLRVGKYDLTVTTGPSFTTRREEAAYSMTEALRAFPDAAPVIVPELAKNLDWPGADKIAEKLEALQSGQPSPEVQQQMDEAAKQIQQLTDENQQLKMDQSVDAAKLQMEREAKAAEMDQKKQLALIEVRAEEEIAMVKIASEERIALRKAQLDAQVAALKAKQQAEATVAAAAMRPQPTGATNGKSS